MRSESDSTRLRKGKSAIDDGEKEGVTLNNAWLHGDGVGEAPCPGIKYWPRSAAGASGSVHQDREATDREGESTDIGRSIISRSSPLLSEFTQVDSLYIACSIPRRIPLQLSSSFAAPSFSKVSSARDASDVASLSLPCRHQT